MDRGIQSGQWILVAEGVFFFFRSQSRHCTFDAGRPMGNLQPFAFTIGM